MTFVLALTITMRWL